MNSPITIRRARPADIDAMTALLGDLFSLEEDFAPNPDLQRKGLAALLADKGRSVLYVAEVEGRVVGMCSVQRLISTALGGPVGLIEDVVCAADHRGKGIGRAMLRALEQWADEQGLGRLQLLADRNNTQALGFYQTLGWSRTQLVALKKTDWS